jgi:ATP-dependent DNA ligase
MGNSIQFIVSRTDGGQELTRNGLDWTHKYPALVAAVSSLRARQLYLDGELCGVGPAGYAGPHLRFWANLNKDQAMAEES